MDTRPDIILKELMGSTKALTSQYLASKLEVSSRTVREDIKGLNDELVGNGATIHSKRGTGYDLVITDNARFRTFLNDLINGDETIDAIPTTPDSRLFYMLKRLLLTKTPIKLDDLADEMHVSKSTLQADLKLMRSILEKHHLTIDSKPHHGMKIDGSELNRRFAMSEYLFNRSTSSPDQVWMDQLAAIVNLSKEKLTDVWVLLLNQLKEHQVTLSDIAINNLFVHISIAYKRIKEGHHVDLIQQEIQDIESKKEFKVAQNIVSEMEQALDVSFPKLEIIYIAIHLLGTKLIQEKQFQEQNVEEVMEPSIITLTNKMLEAIDSKYALNIKNDQELKLGLGLHLKPAINRYKYNMNIRNPMLDDIKHAYPLAFEAGIIASLVLDEELGVSIDENEVAYLALHIGAAMERQKLNTRPKTCYIVCASGVGSAQLIRYRIEAEFRSQIKVLGVTEYYKVKDIPFADTDFIISSVPIKETLPVPVIEVNAILGKKDMSRIDQYVSAKEETVLDYLPVTHLFLNQSLKSMDAVIDFLSEQAGMLDTLPANYKELVYEREEIAPTAYGNLIAVPHPISPQSSQTFLTICTLKRPIDWGERKVQFVCLLNVKKNSQEDLQDLYDILGRIVNDSSLIQRLLTAQTYEDFIGWLT